MLAVGIGHTGNFCTVLFLLTAAHFLLMAVLALLLK
jgi:hypothetical protein